MQNLAIEVLDLDEILEDKIPNQPEDKSVEKKEETPKATDIPSLDDLLVEETPDEEKEKIIDEEGDEKVVKKEKPVKKQEKPVENKKEEPSESSVEVKSLVDYFISQGIWQDFEGREDIEDSEWNDELFKKIQDWQVKTKAEELYENEVGRGGETAKEIIEFVKNGGNPKEISKLFQEQVDIENIDTSTEDGQTLIIKEYYERLGWKPEKINRYIERLKDDGAESFKAEAEDFKDQILKAVQDERKEVLKQQEQRYAQRQAYLEEFNTQVKETIFKDFEDLNDRERKEVFKFLSTPAFKDEEGNTYTALQVKYQEIQKDPKKYAKFVKLLFQFDDLEKSIEKKVQTKEVTKIASFLKKNQSNLGNRSSEDVDLGRGDFKPKTNSPFKSINI